MNFWMNLLVVVFFGCIIGMPIAWRLESFTLLNWLYALFVADVLLITGLAFFYEKKKSNKDKKEDL